ncbi:MAG: class I SAM-dependent methyltransferase [Syntrophorhabdaceae bacterium]|nr:class I SAM-dependent methyltransferase [Syntrophorhabdaceae bacterium]
MKPEEEIRKGLEYFEISVDDDKLKELLIYVNELQRWNRHINLTGKKDVSEIIKELLYDAFFVYKFIDKRSSFLDMGSGSGALSLPIAILDRDLEVYSVEKNIKKIHFQRHIKRLLKLDRFYPLSKKVEYIDDIVVDVIAVKAFGKIELSLHKALRLLKKGGRILLLKGKNANPVEFQGLVITKNILYSLPYSEKMYKLFEYTLEK